MRWWPRSLFMRLLLAMAILLSLAQLAALTIHLQDRRNLMQDVLGRQSAQRIADLVQVLDQQPRDERLAAMRSYRTPGLRLAIVAGIDAAAADLSAPARRFEALLRDALGDQREIRVRLLERPDRPPARVDEPGGLAHGPGHRSWMMGTMHAAAAALRVEIRLSDGAWVRFDRLVPADLFDWPLRLLASIALLLLATLVVVYFAARRLTRPLRDLARAADTLGRDLAAPPLAETGPTETRLAAQAFNRMQARLRNHIEERTRTLTAISHDLKTPLTRLRLRLEFIDDEKLGNGLRRDLNEMEQMLKSSLDFARGLRDEATESVALAPMLQQLVADYTAAGEQVRLGKIDPDLNLRLRPSAIRRCLSNLIDNGLRYGDEVAIDTESDEATLVIKVSDRGPGIADDLLAHVLEPFVRVEDSRNRETGGSGLGLSIARDVAHAHGGELSLHNRPQGGLEARLRLPR